MMIRPLLAAGLATALMALANAQAEPVLKIINFTADWCPHCKILNPRLAEAVNGFDPGKIEIINLDMTEASRRNSALERAETLANAEQLAGDHRVDYLWDWYGGATAIAVVVASDTGEPITCFSRTKTAEAMKKRLNLARLLVENAPPGSRRPPHLECPRPRN